MGHTDLVFGRITVLGEDQIWARYHLGNRDRTKKYMIVLGANEYAITATCFVPKGFAEKERAWDAIATSFRLLPRTVDPAATV